MALLPGAGARDVRGLSVRRIRGHGEHRGRAVQVDPIKLKLKPPGIKILKLKCVILLSTSAFKFNLRRYAAVCQTLGMDVVMRIGAPDKVRPHCHWSVRSPQPVIDRVVLFRFNLRKPSTVLT
jgi:hypothetical protein